MGVACAYLKDQDGMGSGVSPRTPLEFSHGSARMASPVTPISNSETSRSMHPW